MTVWTIFGDRPIADVTLLVVSVILLGVMIYAFVGVLKMRRSLVGRRGYSLTTTMAVVIGSIVVGSILSMANALMIVYDRLGTVDVRVLVFTAEQVIRTSGVLYGMQGVIRIARRESDRERRTR